jgi:hypothetical protein
VRRIHWYTAEKEKTNNTKVIKVKCIAFLISLIFLGDLSTIQFRLTFKGHKSLEYCCLVIHSTSVSIISYAESNRGIFVLIGPYWAHKTRDKTQQKVNRESPRLIRKKTFLEKRNSENVKDYSERLVFQRP